MAHTKPHSRTAQPKRPPSARHTAPAGHIHGDTHSHDSHRVQDHDDNADNGQRHEHTEKDGPHGGVEHPSHSAHHS